MNADKELEKLLEEDIVFEEENLTGNIEIPKIVKKLTMNSILNLIMA